MSCSTREKVALIMVCEAMICGKRSNETEVRSAQYDGGQGMSFVQLRVDRRPYSARGMKTRRQKAWSRRMERQGSAPDDPEQASVGRARNRVVEEVADDFLSVGHHPRTLSEVGQNEVHIGKAEANAQGSLVNESMMSPHSLA